GASVAGAGEVRGAPGQAAPGQRPAQGTHPLGGGRQAVDEKTPERTRAAQREAAADLPTHAPLAAGGGVVPLLERTLAGGALLQEVDVGRDQGLSLLLEEAVEDTVLLSGEPRHVGRDAPREARDD